jgi:hypothetical protein
MKHLEIQRNRQTPAWPKKPAQHRDFSASADRRAKLKLDDWSFPGTDVARRFGHFALSFEGGADRRAE